MHSLTELSQVLAREAIMLGVELTLCGQISDYKNVIVEIKEKIKERIKIQSNLTSSPAYLSKTRELRIELNISSIDPLIIHIILIRYYKNSIEGSLR